MIVTALAAATFAGTATIKVFVVSYFPVTGDQIDRSVTQDVGGSYAELKAKTDRLTKECCEALERGSRFRGYKLDSPPALRYEVVGQAEFKEAIPLRSSPSLFSSSPVEANASGSGLGGKDGVGGWRELPFSLPLPLPHLGCAEIREGSFGVDPPLPDYSAIMKRIDARTWVEEKGVQEIWLWGYHGKIGLWESNMSSPSGDVSNSNRDNDDLPVFKKTYTVYHYNYGRGLGEMLENHMHQLEHLLNWADGRDRTPPEKWTELLFWGKFVGSDASHKIVTNPARCGWTHYAPNSESDYDWANPRYVETDIEDWKPDGIGKTQRMNADRWDRDPIKWRIYWLQAIPGLNHGLTYKGKKLRNWWSFVSDWDRAMAEKWTLVEP